jgi:hypothetical protein
MISVNFQLNYQWMFPNHPKQTSYIVLIVNNVPQNPLKIPIHVIKENVAALDSPHNDVLKGSGRVYSCFSWHLIQIL